MKCVLMYQASEPHLESLRDLSPDLEVVCPKSELEARQAVEKAQIVMGNRYFLQSFPYANALRWFQTNSVGVDLFLSNEEFRRSDILLTNCKGVYDDELADHALAILLCLVRGLHTVRDQQSQMVWKRSTLPSLAGQSALILGAGSLGGAIAKRLNSFGVVCRGVCRTQERAKEHFASIHCEARDWKHHLQAAKFIIVALPLTEETHHFVDDEFLSLMPDDSYLINIGRGSVVCERALKTHCTRFAGVGLDVFENEPLEPEHWLWRRENVLVSPHLGRSVEHAPRRFESLFFDNLKRYLNGEKLQNMVDKELGY